MTDGLEIAAADAAQQIFSKKGMVQANIGLLPTSTTLSIEATGLISERIADKPPLWHSYSNHEF